MSAASMWCSAVRCASNAVNDMADRLDALEASIQGTCHALTQNWCMGPMPRLRQRPSGLWAILAATERDAVTVHGLVALERRPARALLLLYEHHIQLHLAERVRRG